MINRLKKLGIVISIFGLAFVAAGGYAFMKVQEGNHSLNAFSAAQGVKLSYDDQGQLGGATPEAIAIMSLLTNDWGYAVNAADFNPNDPVINTSSEYMYQMATVSYHTLTSTVKVTLTEDTTAADGTVFKAGTYDFPVDGRYYAQFNRANPIEGAARGIAWSPLALSLIGQLGVGAVTASSLQMGLGLAGLFAGVGFMFFLSGIGLVWAVRPQTEKVKVPVLRQAVNPA
jgi:hypothetical protein